MTRQKRLFRALWRPDNTLSVVTIVIATIVVLIEVFHGRVGEQVTAATTIVLLGLVAFSSVIERESRLAQSEAKVDGIQRSIDRISHLLRDSKGTSIFANDRLPHLDSLLVDASEVFVAGAFSFNLLTRDPDRWKMWLGNHKSVKVIVQNPSNAGLKYLEIPGSDYDFKDYKSDTEHVIRVLDTLRVAGPGMEIRLSDTCPTQGIVIVDGQTGGTCMIVALYIPGCGSANRPTMILSRDRDPELFELFYQKYYVHLWKKSQPHLGVRGEA